MNTPLGNCGQLPRTEVSHQTQNLFGSSTIKLHRERFESIPNLAKEQAVPIACRIAMWRLQIGPSPALARVLEPLTTISPHERGTSPLP